MDFRGALDVEDLLKIILVLVVVWLVLQILGEALHTITALVGPILGLVIAALIILWLLDRI